MSWVDLVIDDYYKWLRPNTTIEVGKEGWHCIDTPFVGAFNNSIEIYVQKKEDLILLSDNGETINNLELQGVNIQGSRKRIKSMFKEEAQAYLDGLEIIYTPDFISRGSTGLEFTFDFQIAKREKEIVIKSFNSINKSRLSNFLFSWGDIKPVRRKIVQKEIHAIAIINDTEKSIAGDLLNALKSKEADYILWSQKEATESKRKIAA